MAAAQRDDATGVLTPPARPLGSGGRREFHVNTTIALLAIVAVLVATLAIFASFQGRPVDGRPTIGPSASAAVRVTPNVAGKTIDEAARLLIAAGYRSPVPWQVDPAAQGQACTVARQEPQPGTAVQSGSTAQLFLVGGKDCGGKSKD
jgi:beta-lactam-binding protein with PASTA domain